MSSAVDPESGESGAPVPHAARELHEWMAFRSAPSEREALEQLFEDHHGELIAYVFRRSGDAQATEDIVSETLLRAARARTTLEWRGVPLRGWLLRIATRELATQLRARRPQPAPVDPAAPESAADEHEDLRLALAGLPEELGEALALHYFVGHPVAEVARLLGAPEGTVKSWLARGRALLRERLERFRRKDGQHERT